MLRFTYLFFISLLFVGCCRKKQPQTVTIITPTARNFYIEDNRLYEALNEDLQVLAKRYVLFCDKYYTATEQEEQRSGIFDCEYEAAIPDLLKEIRIYCTADFSEEIKANENMIDAFRLIKYPYNVAGNQVDYSDEIIAEINTMLQSDDLEDLKWPELPFVLQERPDSLEQAYTFVVRLITESGNELEDSTTVILK